MARPQQESRQAAALARLVEVRLPIAQESLRVSLVAASEGLRQEANTLRFPDPA